MKRAMAMACVLGAATPAVARVRGDLLINAGVGQPTGKGTDDYNPGFATSVGGGLRFHPYFSAQGQLHMHVLNIDAPDEVDVSGALVMISLVPWFHALGDEGSVDLRLGPMLGFGAIVATAEANGHKAESTGKEFHVGGQAAALFRLNDTVSIGPWAMYALIFPGESCLKVDGESEICNDDAERDDEGYFSAAVAAHFQF